MNTSNEFVCKMDAYYRIVFSVSFSNSFFDVLNSAFANGCIPHLNFVIPTICCLVPFLLALTKVVHILENNLYLGNEKYLCLHPIFSTVCILF